MRGGHSIGQVAELTGIPVAVLRAWESRFGFPKPRRSEGGMRIYDEREVELLRGIARDREAGLSLPAAIERARGSSPAPERSFFAGLRSRRPQLVPQLMTKAMMLGLSRAIEDECLARAEPCVIFGSFQRVSHYRRAETRWRELARTAEVVAVFADFRRARRVDGSPLEIPVPRRHPLAREWAVVIDGGQFGVCLTAWERVENGKRSERRFEALWSIEPEVVREATRVAAEVLAQTIPEARAALPARLEEPVSRESRDLGALVQLTNRMVAYAHRREQAVG